MAWHWHGVTAMNRLFDEEIRGHHGMRDHLLTVVFDADLTYELPGQNPTLGELLVELGNLEGVYTHSFETLTLDWSHRRLPPRAPITIASLRAWFDLRRRDERCSEPVHGRGAAHQPDDRGHGFVASPFVQYEIYREAVYIFYGKLSVYLKALERDAGGQWAIGVG